MSQDLWLGHLGKSRRRAADEAGASVLMVDRSLIGRGGATVMAQMTVAAALGEQTASQHLIDWIVLDEKYAPSPPSAPALLLRCRIRDFPAKRR